MAHTLHRLEKNGKENKKDRWWTQVSLKNSSAAREMLWDIHEKSDAAFTVDDIFVLITHSAVKTMHATVLSYSTPL